MEEVKPKKVCRRKGRKLEKKCWGNQGQRGFQGGKSQSQTLESCGTSIGLRRSQATARTIQAQVRLTPDCSPCAVNQSVWVTRFRRLNLEGRSSSMRDRIETGYFCLLVFNKLRRHELISSHWHSHWWGTRKKPIPYLLEFFFLLRKANHQITCTKSHLIEYPGLIL